jgi:hypothetical protein
MKRFARYFEVFRNGGEHRRAIAQVLGASPFRSFLDFSDWLHARVGRTNQLALVERCELLFDYLVGSKGLDPRAVAAATAEDFYGDTRRSERLPFLEKHVDRDALIRRQRANRARAHHSAGGTPRGDRSDHESVRGRLIDGPEVIATAEGGNRFTHERESRHGE